MAQAAQLFHVNGPAVLSVGLGTNPASSPLLQLGVSEDGVDIQMNEKLDVVPSDAAGGPAELQRFPSDANISFSLVAYDLAVLQTIRRINGQAEGVQGSPGRLVGSNGDSFRLVIASTDEIWRFLFCVPRGNQGFKLSSKYTAHRMSLYAWSFVPATANTAQGISLYDHVNA